VVRERVEMGESSERERELREKSGCQGRFFSILFFFPEEERERERESGAGRYREEGG
jgi:hypothetical protein